ncbi:MAG: hypothetical protein PHH04_03615 [Thomasclavelia sp.]|nr:hypothetical protein [Thomasclavelia sp.]
MKVYKAITFKEKQTVLKDIFSKYKKAKLKLELLENKNFYPSFSYNFVGEARDKYKTTNMISVLDEYLDDKTELEYIIVTFDTILDSLTDESRMIIEHDFLLSNNKSWYLDYYSKSTYYRMKTKAMEEILFYLNV